MENKIDTLKEKLQYLKKGSKIHIKKSHEGLFTQYCNGKVTSECIARGKRSPDPAIRKRATFAANARKWKHANGGTMEQAYIDSLDQYIKANPVVHGINTADFRDTLIEIARRESSFNPKAKQGSYYGYYQTRVPVGADSTAQHNMAFKHLSSLFRDTISKADIDKAHEMGLSDAQLLIKYWNQGNKVNNYLWNNKDSQDGLGTSISKYGNDIQAQLDMYKYAMDNLSGEYEVKNGDNWFNLQKRVRTEGRDYATAGKDLWNILGLAKKYGALSIGQKLNFGNGYKKQPVVEYEKQSIPQLRRVTWDPEVKLKYPVQEIKI